MTHYFTPTGRGTEAAREAEPVDAKGGPVSASGAPMADIAPRLLAVVAPLLHRSAFERRSRWSQAVVIIRHEEKRVTSRADFAGWLRAHGLDTTARECTSRRTPPGSLLVWLEVDTEDVAAAGFVVFDMSAALARLTQKGTDR